MRNSLNTNPALPSERNVHLDAMRGLAAVSVLCTHLRGLFFVPYHQAGSGLLVKILYIDHYVARAAVIFFFALSGYLVGMSAVNAIESGRWSWRDYMLSRLSRLYVVLIPALFMTALLDWIGRSNPVSRWAYFNDPLEAGFTTAHMDTLKNFFGTLFFLQNIHTGWFGSNSPLWSLSCEFWYYILFPVIALTVLRRKGWVWSLLFLAAMGWFLGGFVVTLFPCWLAGVAVGMLARRRLPLSPALRRVLACAAILGLLGAIAAAGAHKLNGYAADYVVALIAMLLIWVALSSPAAWKPYAAVAVFLSEISYTLYVTHLPFLLLVKRSLMPQRLWAADLRHVCFVMVPFIAALLFAYGNYLLFESRTGEVRRWLKRVVPRAQPRAEMTAVQAP
jgi:peptidoglycan/LPS O-acetylase OafA/YrhL